MRPVPERATAFVRAHEDRRLAAYQDIGGVWTIGFGHTGPEAGPGRTITARQAALYLKEDLATAARRLAGVVKPAVIAELTENQYAALLSFVFNLGADPRWRIWAVLNARDFERTPAQLQRFVFVGKRRVQGLANRRAAEAALWRTGEPGTDQQAFSSAATRFAETPPAPAEQPKATPIVTAAVATLSAAPVAARQVMDAVSPYAGASNVVSQAMAAVATIAAAAAVALLAIQWIENRRAQR